VADPKPEETTLEAEVTEDEGPTVESVQADAAKFKSALMKERKVVAKLRKDLDPFKDLDATAAREALTKLEEIEEAAAAAAESGEGDKPNPAFLKLEQDVKRLKNAVEAGEKTLAAEKKERDVDRKLFNLKQKESMATDALLKHVSDPADVKILKRELLARMVEEEGETHNGSPIYRVPDDDGEPRLVTKLGDTNPDKILAEYVGKDMRAEFPKNFGGTKAAGGGLTGIAGKTEDGEFVVKRGATPAEYQRVREAAQKVGKLPTITD